MSDLKPGPTGEFPEGKLVAGDEGEIVFTVGQHHDHVLVTLGIPVQWLAMHPRQAREIAEELIRVAERIETAPPESPTMVIVRGGGE